MATIGNVVVKFGADIKGYTTDVKRMSKLSKQHSADVKAAFTKMGAGVTAVMGLAINEAIKFEKAMAEVSTLVGDTTNMDALTDSVRNLSMEFGAAPVDTAKALYQIISAGASDAASQMALLTAANKLAIGGVTDVATAADGLTGVLNAYGMGAEHATEISDIMFATMKAGKTTIGEIAQNISQVTPIAATMGITFDQVGAALATVTAITGNTAIASTQLRSAISAIAAPAEKSKKMFAELGLEFGQAAIEMKGGLLPYMQDLMEKTGGSTVKLKKLLGSVEGVNGVLALATDNFGKFAGALEQTENAAGATETAYEKMANSADQNLKKVKASGQVLLTVLGANLLPIVNKVAKAFIQFAAPLKSIDDNLKGLSRTAMTVGSALRSGSVDAQLLAESLLKVDMVNLQADLKAAEEELRIWQDDIIKWTHVGEHWREEIDRISAAIKLNERQTKRINKELDENAKLTEIVVKAEKLHFKELKGMVTMTEKQYTAYQKLMYEMHPLLEITDNYKRELKEVNDISELLNWTEAEKAAALAFVADKFGDAAMAAQGFDTELEEVIVTAKRMKDVKVEVDGLAAVLENSFKRLDDTFAGFWENIVKNGKISLSSIKDLFLDTIAQMLHAAITQPIVLRIGTMMTGGLASGAANAAGGSIFGGAGFLGGAMGGALAGAAGGFLGGSALFGNTEAGIGGAIGGAAGSLFLGGIGGSLVGAFSSTALGTAAASAIGASTFTAIASIAAPIIGTLIGALVGSIVGNFFASNPQIRAGGENAFGNLKDTQFFDSQLGGVYVGKTKGGLDKHVEEFGKAIADFDNALASFMSEAQIEKAADAVAAWSLKLKGGAISIEAMLEGRFAAVLSTFSNGVQNYVKQFEGLEAQSDALQKYVVALNSIGKAIAVFTASNAADILAEQLENAATTSTEKLSSIGESLSDMFSSFDGTPEQLNQITQLIDARYRGELEYLVAVDNLIKGISQSIADQQQSIREAIEGPQSFDQMMGDAQALYRSLGTAGSPEEIASIVSQIQSLVGKAFGGLDEAGKAAQADTLIAFLDRVERAATLQAEMLAQMVVDQGDILREQALLFADAIGAPLDLNVQATQDVSAAVNNQTDILVDEHRTGQAIDTGIRDSIDRLAAELRLLIDSQPRTIGG